uniref:Uncharacterized protein n=1 Tax=Arundo donax TaxID=35708 RepID=A0A0A9FKL2_ARUDO
MISAHLETTFSPKLMDLSAYGFLTSSQLQLVVGFLMIHLAGIKSMSLLHMVSPKISIFFSRQSKLADR